MINHTHLTVVEIIDSPGHDIVASCSQATIYTKQDDNWALISCRCSTTGLIRTKKSGNIFYVWDLEACRKIIQMIKSSKMTFGRPVATEQFKFHLNNPRNSFINFWNISIRDKQSISDSSICFVRTIKNYLKLLYPACEHCRWVSKGANLARMIWNYTRILWRNNPISKAIQILCRWRSSDVWTSKDCMIIIRNNLIG